MTRLLILGSPSERPGPYEASQGLLEEEKNGCEERFRTLRRAPDQQRSESERDGLGPERHGARANGKPELCCLKARSRKDLL